MVKDWVSKGSTYSSSKNREAPNKHLKGGKKYKEMIDKGSKAADGKNLPFQFIKPPKRTQPRRDVWSVCGYCDNVLLVNRNTIGSQCSRCAKYVSIDETNKFASEDELYSYIESLGKEVE